MSKGDRNIKKYFNILLTIIFLSLFAIYFFFNKEDLKTVLFIDWKYFLTIAIVTLGLFFIEGIFIKIILKAFDKNIDVNESVYLSTLSRIGNYLLPLRAGAAMRAAYLKKKFDFPYSQFLSTLSGYYIILFLLYSFLALIGLGVKYFINDEFYLVLTLFFFAVFVAMLILSLIKVPLEKIPDIKVRILDKVVKFVKKILEGWNIITNRKDILFKLVLVTFGNIFLSTIISIIEFKALGINIGIANIVLYSCLAGVSLLISITPGSLGLREALFLLTSESLGLKNEYIMQMALLDRGIMFGLLLILSIVIIFLSKKFNAQDILKQRK